MMYLRDANLPVSSVALFWSRHEGNHAGHVSLERQHLQVKHEFEVVNKFRVVVY